MNRDPRYAAWLNLTGEEEPQPVESMTFPQIIEELYGRAVRVGEARGARAETALQTFGLRASELMRAAKERLDAARMPKKLPCWVWNEGHSPYDSPRLELWAVRNGEVVMLGSYSSRSTALAGIDKHSEDPWLLGEDIQRLIIELAQYYPERAIA